jgi:FkbM family methyltransferase
LQYLADIMDWSGACFVDIGANAGLFSLRAALAATGPARIIAIEPDTSLLERLKFNLATARNLGKVRPGVDVEMVVAAISDRSGQGILTTQGDEGARHLVDGGVGQMVNLTTLNDVISNAALHRIDVLKIDVEGHEDKVLPPFFATAPKALWPTALIIEHISRDHWQIDCISDAIARGYSVSFTTNNNTILER